MEMKEGGVIEEKGERRKGEVRKEEGGGRPPYPSLLL